MNTKIASIVAAFFAIGINNAKAKEQAFQPHFDYTVDVLSNKGTSQWIGLADISAEYTTGTVKWFGLYHINQGHAFNANTIESSMGVSNIETARPDHRLFQAWAEISITPYISLLGGLYPVDSEFVVTPTSGIFIHPSMGMSPEIGQGADHPTEGTHGPSIYNASTFGVRFKHQKDARYTQVAINDAVPDNHHNAIGVSSPYQSSDGAFLILESGIDQTESQGTKTGVGVWWYTKQYNTLSTGQEARYGVYGLHEQAITNDIRGFIRGGYANPNVHEGDYHFSLGAVKDESIGVMFSSFNPSKTLKSTSPELKREMAVEVTASYDLAQYGVLSPVLQYHWNSGFTPENNQLILGARYKISF